MKKLLLMCLAAAFSSGALAAGVDAPKTAQQSKMTACNADAKGIKGEERKAFMKKCLSATPEAPAAPVTQQSKMTSCNADAKGMKGDARKDFMKTCLSNPKK